MDNLVVNSNKTFTLEKYLSQVKIITQNSINEVLKASAESEILSSDCSAGVVIVSGKIKLKVLYLNEDNIIESAYAEADFIEKQKQQFEMNNLIVFDNLEVCDLNFSSNEIMCSVRHNTEIMGIYDYVMPSFEENQEAVCNYKQMHLTKFICQAEDTFCVSEESETNLKNIEILNVNVQIVVDGIVCSVDKVVVEGRILSEIVYKDENNLASMLKVLDYKQEVAADGVVPTMKANAFVFNKNAKVEVQENNDKFMIAYDFDILTKINVYEDIEINVANDMFLLNNNVDVVYDYIETKNYLEIVEQSETIISQTDITHIDDFDDIIGVFEPKIEVVSVENFDQIATVCAKITPFAVYKKLEGFGVVEINQEIKFDIVKNENQYIDKVDLVCEILSFKVKAGKEIEVSLKIGAHSSVVNYVFERYVKAYDIVSEKESEDAGIKVYIARQNQNLFDIAKALNVSPELICSQNEVEDVFEEGQKIYVYSPINLL